MTIGLFFRLFDGAADFVCRFDLHLMCEVVEQLLAGLGSAKSGIFSSSLTSFNFKSSRCCLSSSFCVLRTARIASRFSMSEKLFFNEIHPPFELIFALGKALLFALHFLSFLLPMLLQLALLVDLPLLDIQFALLFQYLRFAFGFAQDVGGKEVEGCEFDLLAKMKTRRSKKGSGGDHADVDQKGFGCHVLRFMLGVVVVV